MLTSLSLNEITVGKTIKATLYGPINGVTTLTGKVVSVLSYEGVPPWAGVNTHHANIYPELPESVRAIYDNDPTSYTYIAVKNGDTVHYIGLPWIVESALYLETAPSVTVTLTDFTDVDTSALKHLLTENGYSVSTVVVNNG